jgi:hypothetical protein
MEKYEGGEEDYQSDSDSDGYNELDRTLDEELKCD